MASDMRYDDSALLSPQGYEQMAKAYASMREKCFCLVSYDSASLDKALSDVFDTLFLLKDHLFALGGFLGTGALYNQNEKQIWRLQNMFGHAFEHRKTPLLRDKTKLFLNTISLESLLTARLLELAFSCDKTSEIVVLIKERATLSSALFKINGIISTYFQ